MMFDKLIESRKASIAKLEAELSELRLRYNGLDAVKDVAIRRSVGELIYIREHRLMRLRADVEAFSHMVKDSRQLEVAGVVESVGRKAGR